MKGRELEAAWTRHVKGDLSVKDSLVLEFTKLAPAKWVKLQQNALAPGVARGDRGPADALEKFAGHVKSPLVLEATIARAYQRAGAYDRAIELAARALEVTPRWDPTWVALVANTVASSLFHRKDFEGSLRWAERAVAADPTNPFALGTLCQSLAQTDRAKALPVYRRLANAGFSASVWEPFDPGAAGKKAKAKPLTSGDFEKHTDDDAHRLRIANRFDSNLAEPARYQGQALVLAGAGRFGPAYVAASIAHALGEGIVKLQAKMVKDALAPALDARCAKEVDAAKGRFARDPETRAKALEKLVTAKDDGAIADMVFDAHYGVSMAACETLIRRGDAKSLVPYLELAATLEHATGQSILYDGFPKPFDIVSGARQDKPKAAGPSLVEQVIAKVREGDKDAISIPAPEPVPEAVLEKLVLAEGVPLSPSLRAWLAFDGGWIGRQHGWFKDPASPVLSPQFVHALVHEHISDVFAPAFLELPGKLADARALPLDIGSESMRMLALVPGPTGEYPVLYIDVDDNPMIGVEAPSFDVWLASRGGLVGDVGRQYDAELKKVGKFLFGGKESYAYLEYAEAPDGFTARVKEAKKKAIDEGKRLAEAWKGLAPKKPKGKASIPELPEPKLAEALAEAIEGKRTDRMRAFLEDAKARFPKGKKWKNAAVGVAARQGNVELVRELLDLGADVNAKYYLENRLIHASASPENPALMRLLLERGADVEARGYSKQTPLHDACDDRHVEAVRILLAHGVDVNARDQNQRTPLMEASRVFAQSIPPELPKTVEIARLLLDAGADVNAGNKNTTPLHEAIEQRNHELAKLLIERGADPLAKDYAGDDALMTAKKANDLKTFDLLRARGVKPADKNRKGLSLGDVVQEDGITPAVFEVRVRCSDAPQNIRVRARWTLAAGRSREQSCHERVSALANLAAAGMAGSDAWPPLAGRGTLELTTKEEKKDKKAYQADWREVLGSGTVAGVSPAALAMVVRGLYDTSGHTLIQLEIEGELPLDGGPMSVDTHRAKGWLRDATSEPYRRWPALTAKVAEVPARDRYGTVTLTADGKGAVDAFARAFNLARELSIPRGVKDLRDRSALSGRPLLRRTEEGGVLTLDYWYVAFGSMRRAELDSETLRAVFAHGVEVLEARKAITSASWSLGVAGAPPKEGFDDGLAGRDVVEVSASSRATCPKCKDTLEKGELRFVETTFVGRRYYHLTCAAERLPTRLQGALGRYKGEVPEREELDQAIAKSLAKRTGTKAPKGPASGDGPSPAEEADGEVSARTGAYPYVEVAKTGRSSCVKCAKAIEKASLRVAIPRQVETPTGTMTRPGYLHPACARGYEGVTIDAVLANTDGLSSSQEAALRGAIG